MRENSYAELMVHVPVCTHKEPKNILVVSDDASALMDEIAKYGSMEARAVDCNVDALRDMDQAIFDIVISENVNDPVSIAHIGRVLKEDGVASFASFNLEEKNTATPQIEEIGKYFKIAMPYFLLDTTENMALLASRQYHPTADINLQRADLTDGFTVYNSDLHIGIFAMPTYIKKNYLGIVKN